MKKSFEYVLFADCQQFYLQDEWAEESPDNSWTTDADHRLLAIEPGIIRVGTVCNANVRVVVEINDGEPNENTSPWDQVNECTLELPSGRLVIAGGTDDLRDAARIELFPGPYRARIHYGNLGSLCDHGQGNDHYKVVLWTTAPRPLQVLKPRRDLAVQPSLTAYVY